MPKPGSLKGFQLIVRRLSQFADAAGYPYTENDIAKYLKRISQAKPVRDDATSLEESEQEVWAFIQSNNRAASHQTEGSAGKFESKPYGWNYPGCAVHGGQALRQGQGRGA
jgi:hypothetical protein